MTEKRKQILLQMIKTEGLNIKNSYKKRSFMFTLTELLAKEKSTEIDTKKDLDLEEQILDLLGKEN